MYTHVLCIILYLISSLNYFWGHDPWDIRWYLTSHAINAHACNYNNFSKNEEQELARTSGIELLQWYGETFHSWNISPYHTLTRLISIICVATPANYCMQKDMFLKGRDEPKSYYLCRRPESSFFWLFSPLKSLKFIIWRHYKWTILGVLLFILLMVLVLAIVFTLPVSHVRTKLVQKITSFFSSPRVNSSKYQFKKWCPNLLATKNILVWI